MNKKRAFIVVLLALVLTFVCAFAAACNKKNDDVKNVEVTAVTLDKETAELQLGGTTTVTLKATVTPDNATNKTVTWTSSEQSVATVSDGGTVTAVAPGSTTITATAGGKSDTCVVVVRPAPATVAVTGVSLNKTTVSLKMGVNESTTLTPTVSPDNATNKNVTWSSSDTTVVTVSGGAITALKAGTASITVKTEDGNHTATCEVTVQPADVTPATEYTVTFNMNGHGEDIAPATTVDGKITAPTAPTAAGFVFGGWFETAACDGTAIDFATKEFTADTTVYAKWTAESTDPEPATEYTVTFNMNGHGEDISPAQTVDGKITAPTAPTAAGFVFGGWFETAACDGTAIDFATKVFTENTTVYAKWTAESTDPEPSDYTADGDYVLDIANEGATAS
ncbi:MAG: Ig domain-containing protein, partial [Candidatus Coproplasma sp.]